MMYMKASHEAYKSSRENSEMRTGFKGGKHMKKNKR